MSLLPQVTL
jgi:transposase InsO family protein